MTEGYTLKLLRTKLEALTTERNKIRELKPEELGSIESHYNIIITDLQKSVEKLTMDDIKTSYSATSGTNSI
jgi:hypothetical protein